MSDESRNEPRVVNIRERLGKDAKRSTKQVKSSGAGVAPPPESIGSVAPPPQHVGQSQSSMVPSDPYRNSMLPSRQLAPTAQQVRIVVDEDAVNSAKAGMHKDARRQAMIVGGIAAAIGIVLGGIAASTIASRRDYNRSINDGKAIYTAVREASDKVIEVSSVLDRAYNAAQATATHPTPEVDYAAIEMLREAVVPFSAKDFTGRQFLKFTAETVNTLFAYNTSIGAIWDRFDALAAKTLPETRRAALTSGAADTGAVGGSPTGCVIQRDGGSYRCGLVFVQTSGGSSAKVQPTRGTTAIEKTVFTGSLGSDPSGFVVLVNPEASAGVLGTQSNAFVAYRKELTEIKEELAKAMELQGKLEKGLGEVAALDSIGTI